MVILLWIFLLLNSVGASSGKTSDGGDLPPIIKKREITTKFMTKDGDTVVIGGIYQKVQKEDSIVRRYSLFRLFI